MITKDSAPHKKGTIMTIILLNGTTISVGDISTKCLEWTPTVLQIKAKGSALHSGANLMVIQRSQIVGWYDENVLLNVNIKLPT
jgi:hypothetical protein